jgi:hypothetical protein
MLDSLKKVSRLFPGQSDILWVRIAILTAMTLGFFLLFSIVLMLVEKRNSKNNISI